MILVKVTKKDTQDEIENIASVANPAQLQILEKIYSKFEYVEFVDENKMVSMFCVVDDYTIKDLVENYINLSIDFSFEDLTKDVFLCNDIKTDFLGDDDIDMTDMINELVTNFYKNNVEVDDILDKILVKGVTSINDFDKLILENV
jgi:hypothetical protein